MAKSRLRPPEIAELKRAHAKEIAELKEAHIKALEAAWEGGREKGLQKATDMEERASRIAIHAERTAKDALKRAGEVLPAPSVLPGSIIPDISEEVDLEDVMNVDTAYHDVEANPKKAISEAQEIATNLSIDIKDTIREAQELADATAVAAQAEADRVRVIAESQVEEARAHVKEVERMAAEAVQERAETIAKQNRVNKNWEGKQLLPRAEQKIAETAEQVAKAAEEAKIKRSVEAEALSTARITKEAAERAAKHAAETAKKVKHILSAKKHKKKHKP